MPVNVEVATRSSLCCVKGAIVQPLCMQSISCNILSIVHPAINVQHFELS